MSAPLPRQPERQAVSPHSARIVRTAHRRKKWGHYSFPISHAWAADGTLHVCLTGSD